MITEALKKNKTFRSNAIILHLDGDKKYSKRALNYYNNLNLKAIVENISEKEQPSKVLNLLEKWNPDILISTRTR